jgi:hypothetical protein
MNTHTNALTNKEQALAGLGAAVAAGCQPCTRSFIAKARAAGACERSIRLAIETGFDALTSAAEAMVSWARAEQGQAPDLDTTFRNQKEKLAALIATSATFAARSTVTLEARGAQCRASGWIDRQISEALTIAGSIAATASSKTESLATRLGIAASQQADTCCSQPLAGDAASISAAPQATPAPCNCAKAADGA